MNGADLIVVIAVAAAVLLAAAIMRRNQKNGKRGCGCQCPGCGGSCGKGGPSHRNRRAGG